MAETTYSAKQLGRIASGLCLRCERPRDSVELETMCRACADLVKVANTDRRLRYKQQGLCWCGKKLLGKAALCIDCATKLKALGKQDAVRRQQRREAGLCYRCGQPRLGNVTECEKHWWERTAKTHLGSGSRGLELRDEYLRRGGSCHFTGLPLSPGVNLSIDHLDPSSRYPTRKHELANIVFCLGSVNFVKGALTEEEFLALVHRIAERLPKPAVSGQQLHELLVTIRPTLRSVM